MRGNSTLHFHSNCWNRPGSECVYVEMRRWRWWATRLCGCRFGCSKYIAGCPIFALLELGLLTLQTVSHCHSADWGGVRKTHSMATCNYSNSQRNILKNMKKSHQWEKLRETKAKGWSEAVARSAPWPAVAASFTLPCSTSPPKVTACGCALESNPECSSHNKWHC